MNDQRVNSLGRTVWNAWPSMVLQPALVVCPFPLAQASMPSMVQDIYQLAYERARAAARPSLYEVARQACWN